MFSIVFFFQAEDGIRDLVRSRGLGDVYKRQLYVDAVRERALTIRWESFNNTAGSQVRIDLYRDTCLLYTSDAADERSSVDLGGRRIIKKTNTQTIVR